MGYFAAVFLQTLWLILIWLTISCELSLFVRFFILLSALAKDIVTNKMEFENTFENKIGDEKTVIERKQMMEEIIEIVRFHVEAKEFVSIFH